VSNSSSSLLARNPNAGFAFWRNLAWPCSAQPSEAEWSSTRVSKANIYVIRLLAVLCLCNDCTFQDCASAAEHLDSPTGIGRRPIRHLLNATPYAVAEVGARRSPWFPMNGGWKCPLKNHDALLSFSQRWRSVPSRLLPLRHLRLAHCMPGRWYGRSCGFTSWRARPRCARRGRKPKATSLIHSRIWNEDASPRILFHAAHKADVRRGARPQR
jgi:hypothetical protein